MGSDSIGKNTWSWEKNMNGSFMSRWRSAEPEMSGTMVVEEEDTMEVEEMESSAQETQ